MLRAQITQVLSAAAIMLSAFPIYAQTATATKVISDQVLPSDTYMYVSFPNVTAMKEHLVGSSMGQLWNDPGLDEFKTQLYSAYNEKMQDNLQQVTDALGLSVGELMEIPNGEVSMAIAGAPGNAMGVVIFLDYGDKESEVQSLMTKAADALNNVPKLSSDDTSFDGTEITRYKIQYPGPAPTPLAKEFGWFLKDQRLVISNRTELLESTLTNWAGDSDSSFRSNEAYSYIMSKCQSSERSSLTTFYFDPIGLFTKLVQTGSLGQQASMGAGMALGFLPTLGLTQMKAMGAVSEAGTGDFEAVSRSVFYMEQPAMGIMQVFQLDQIEATPPEWVKDNVTTYVATKWKIDEAYNAIESLVDMFSGAGALADRLQQMADRGPGIHVKHDIVDQLNGDLKLITAPGATGGYGGDQMLVALGVRDDGSAGDVLAKIAEVAGLETREFRGTTMYEVQSPGGDQSIALAISGGKLLFSVGGAMLEQVLRNDSDMRPLAESDEYKRVAQHYPSNALSVQFSRPAEQYRSMYEMLRSGTAAEQFPGMDEIFEEIDFTTLPPFETLSKYIHPTGGYTVKDDNGVFMEAFQLKD